jgi:hypothetical protein
MKDEIKGEGSKQKSIANERRKLREKNKRMGKKKIK